MHWLRRPGPRRGTGRLSSPAPNWPLAAGRWTRQSAYWTTSSVTIGTSWRRAAFGPPFAGTSAGWRRHGPISRRVLSVDPLDAIALDQRRRLATDDEWAGEGDVPVGRPVEGPLPGDVQTALDRCP